MRWIKGQLSETKCRVGGSDVGVVSQVRVVFKGGRTGEGELITYGSEVKPNVEWLGLGFTKLVK
jgi:hypothetical protein